MQYYIQENGKKKEVTEYEYKNTKKKHGLNEDLTNFSIAGIIGMVIGSSFNSHEEERHLDYSTPKSSDDSFGSSFGSSSNDGGSFSGGGGDFGGGGASGDF